MKMSNDKDEMDELEEFNATMKKIQEQTLNQMDKALKASENQTQAQALSDISDELKDLNENLVGLIRVLKFMK
jgi:hypothetical protein